mmetsp:Transcript_27/g.91  ORF Transcript_27/g.91 Transcript_27/m.91 type:complete len:439 (+) Transcript_27:141-1457(+)
MRGALGTKLLAIDARGLQCVEDCVVEKEPVLVVLVVLREWVDAVCEEDSDHLALRVAANLCSCVADVHPCLCAEEAARQVPAVVISGGVVGAPSKCSAALGVVVLGGEVVGSGLVKELAVVVSIGEHDAVGKNEEVRGPAEDACVSGDATKSVSIAVGHLSLDLDVLVVLGDGVVLGGGAARPHGALRQPASHVHAYLLEDVLPRVCLEVAHARGVGALVAAGNEVRATNVSEVARQHTNNVLERNEGEVRVDVHGAHGVLERLVQEAVVDLRLAAEVLCRVLVRSLRASELGLPVVGGGVRGESSIVEEAVQHSDRALAVCVEGVAEELAHRRVQVELATLVEGGNRRRSTRHLRAARKVEQSVKLNRWVGASVEFEALSIGVVAEGLVVEVSRLVADKGHSSGVSEGADALVQHLVHCVPAAGRSAGHEQHCNGCR